MRRLCSLLVVALLLAALPAAAQDDDQSRLVTFIENSLSDGAARQIDIEGFSGALSSQAELDRLTISDEQGVWLVLEGAVLDWTRTALLSRELRVNALTAERLEIRRAPIPDGGTLPDQAEAQPFSLPELPIAIEVAEFRIDRVELGEAFIGEPIALAVTGQAALEEGAGTVNIDIDRLDGATGHFDLRASYSNETDELDLLLDLQEGPGGIAASRLNLPGAPAVELTIDGDGTLADFLADVTLATDGVDRLTGQVELIEQDSALAIIADLGGDITPLVSADISGFFGDQANLSLRALRQADGGFDVETLAIRTADFTLNGVVRIDADGVPTFFDINGRLGNPGPNPEPVRLPVPDAEVLVDGATLDMAFDAAGGDAWTLRFVARGFEAPDLALDRLVFNGDGRITSNGATGVTGSFTLALEDLEVGDPATGEALGRTITANADLDWREGRSLRLSDLLVEGDTLALSANAEVTGGAEDLQVELGAGLEVERLAAFAALADTPLAGAVNTTLDGTIRPLDGAFDLRLNGSGTDLRLGPEVTADLFTGTTEFVLTARRDETGTFVEQARIVSAGFEFEGSAGAIGGGEALEIDLDAGIALADLSVLSDLVGTPLAGSLSVDAEGFVQPGPLDFALSVDGTGQGLRYGAGDAALDLPGSTQLDIVASRQNGVIAVERADLVGPGLNLAAEANSRDAEQPDIVDFTLALALDDLSRLSGLAGTPLGGHVDIEAEGWTDLQDRDLSVELAGTGTDLQLGDDLGDALLQGETRLDIAASWIGGVAEVDRLDLAGPGLSLEATLAAADDEGALRYDLGFDAEVADIARFSVIAGLDLGGSVTAAGTASAQPETGDFEVDIDGTGVDLRLGGVEATGLLDGTTRFSVEAARRNGILLVEEAQVTASGVDVTARAAPVAGSDLVEVTAEIDIDSLAPFSGLAGQPLSGAIAAELEGTYDPATLDVAAALDATGTDLRFGPDITARLFPGTTDLSVDFRREGDRITVDEAVLQGAQLSADLSGELGNGGTAVTGNARLADVGVLTDALSGAITTDLTLSRDGDGPIRIDTVSRGPGGLTASIQGAVGLPGGAVDIAVTGSAPLALADPFLGTRSIQGTAQFDLAVQGQPGLDAITGTVTVSGARIAAPRLGNAVENVEARLTLRGGGAQVEATGSLATGGQLGVSGRVGVTSALLPSSLTIQATGLRLIDPRLYDATIDSVALLLEGDLAGQSRLSGQVALGRVEVRIPSSPLGGAEPIPQIDHIGTTLAQRLTQERAGLLEGGAGLGPPPPPPAGPGGGQQVVLDVDVIALNRIFIRGRGLDAELGGRLSLAGTLNSPIPAGQFDLLRGRLNLLGRRLDLTEGFVTLQGDFAPFLRLVAVSTADDLTVRIIVEGPLQDPSITIRSVPDLPQDEILARFFFGQNVQNLSAIQALQLASAVAELSGRSSGGVLLSLREGLGLDNLDVRTDEAGNAAVTAGRYISDNIYTDVTVGAEGDTEVSINIDLTPNLTARGTAASDGDSTIGIYFERDY